MPSNSYELFPDARGLRLALMLASWPWPAAADEPSADQVPTRAGPTPIPAAAGDAADRRPRRRRRHRGLRERPTAARTPKRPRSCSTRCAGDAVFTAGDNAYFNATAARFPELLRAALGTPQGAHLPEPGQPRVPGRARSPYFDYFGDRAGPRGAGFYSYKLGNWHIISLNSNVGVTPGQEQYLWLQRDLEDEQALERGAKCNLAYWHHPLFTSGPSAGSSGRHARHLAPALRVRRRRGDQRPRPPLRAVRGAGRDRPPRRLRHPGIHRRHRRRAALRFRRAAPNSVFRLKAYGVLKLTLRDVGYDSVFIEAGTELQHDPTFSNLCH